MSRGPAEDPQSGAARTRLTRFAPISRRVLDPVARRLAGHLPRLGILVHTGRMSGRRYETPVMRFGTDEEVVIALGSGSASHWVQNVLAAGGCDLRTGQRTIRLVDPRIRVDPRLRLLPRPLRWLGAAIGLSEFLLMRTAAPPTYDVPPAIP